MDPQRAPCHALAGTARRENCDDGMMSQPQRHCPAALPPPLRSLITTFPHISLPPSTTSSRKALLDQMQTTFFTTTAALFVTIIGVVSLAALVRADACCMVTCDMPVCEW